MNPKIIIHYLSLITIIALVFGVLWWSVVGAIKTSQSRQVASDAEAIVQALEYFYQDQRRYPTTGEFTDENLMRQYLSGYPPREFISEVCQKNFDYLSVFNNKYELRVCVIKPTNSLIAGWNVINSPAKQ